MLDLLSWLTLPSFSSNPPVLKDFREGGRQNLSVFPNLLSRNDKNLFWILNFSAFSTSLISCDMWQLYETDNFGNTFIYLNKPTGLNFFIVVKAYQFTKRYSKCLANTSFWQRSLPREWMWRLTFFVEVTFYNNLKVGTKISNIVPFLTVLWTEFFVVLES